MHTHNMKPAFAETLASTTSSCVSSTDFDGSLSPSSWTCPESFHYRAFETEGLAGGAEVERRGGRGGGGVVRRACRTVKSKVRRGVLLCFGVKRKTVSLGYLVNRG